MAKPRNTPVSAIAVLATDVPLAAGDPARRWALRDPGGRPAFPGLTGEEAERVYRELCGRGAPDWEDALVRVELPVVLSEGAGPHLLARDGGLVLAVGTHPARTGERVALGRAGAAQRVGVVAAVGSGPVWLWRARADVPVAQRVGALDDLAAAADEDALRAWAVRWGGAVI